jgi:glycyl-tRNA synthetase
MKNEVTMEQIISLCKRRGFIFPSSEIYGGIGGVYDYGPIGVELKNNIKRAWWKSMVRENENIVGLDAAILMNPTVWEASGHVENFSDPLVDCTQCKKRFRADHLIEQIKGEELEEEDGITTSVELEEIAKELKNVTCPECEGELTEPRQFNLLMKTYLGVVEDSTKPTYLRGETCQGIYTNFQNVKESMRKKLPFGIAQIGKAFRNEITPGNFTFRTREFEQMEMQLFVHPDEDMKWFDYWLDKRYNWYLNLGIDKNKLRKREHRSDELAHYAKKAVDIEYKTPFGWKELEGVHHRSDWDLSRHSQFSGKDLSVYDEEKKEKFIPFIIETSAGADRASLVFLLDAYKEIEGGRTTTTDSIKESETMMNFYKDIAPVKIAVLPLSKKEELTKVAKPIYEDLRSCWMTQYDLTGSIGKRYRRQDEIGTLYCITVDFDSIEDKSVTVRDRDTMEQERVKIDELKKYLHMKII